MADDVKTCAHPNCNCKVQAGQKYCCSACENAEPSASCACGHDCC